jgi:hypothetical protein
MPTQSIPKWQGAASKQIQAELLDSQPGFQAIRLGGRDDRSHRQHQESWVSLWEYTSSPLLLQKFKISKF